jgi:hypothetical protein
VSCDIVDGHHTCVHKGKGDGQEVVDIDLCFTEVFRAEEWQLRQVLGSKGEQESQVEGPSIWHPACSTLTHVLVREDPRCHGCCNVIPSPIQVVFSLLNFKYGQDATYFR